MAKKKRQAPVKLPGTSSEAFIAAIEALVELRDSGKFIIFLGRSGRVRIVGDLADLVAATQAPSDQTSDEEQVKKLVTEIQNYCQAWAFFNNIKRTTDFLVEAVYDDDIKSLNDEQKNLFRAREEEKLDAVSRLLFIEAMKDRGKRLRTATLPCIEDLDAELIQSRRDDLAGKVISQPFLRLRIRYSQQERNDIFSRLPWGTPASAEAFELECDESDIDLLMVRLTAAKELLLEQHGKTPEESADN